MVSSFHPLEETAWAPPSLADGKLYLRDQSQVMAFDVRGVETATMKDKGGR